MFDIRDQVHVSFHIEHDDLLIWITLGIGVLQDIQDIPVLDVEDHILKPDPPLSFERGVLFRAPIERAHGVQNTRVCAYCQQASLYGEAGAREALKKRLAG